MIITGGYSQLGCSIRAIVSDHNFLSRKELDISNKSEIEKVFSGLKYNGVVVNCAAYTDVDGAEDDEASAYGANHLGVQNLVEACSKFGHQLIHVSTDYVFDGSQRTPYTESDLCNPLGVYGKSKRVGEEAIINSEIDYVIIRTSWLYSEFGKNFFKTMISLKNRNELNVVHDQVGSPTYARDLANFILTISENFSQYNREIIHFSNEGSCSWHDFAQAIMNEACSECIVRGIPTEEYPTRAIRPRYSVLSTGKARSYGIEVPDWRKSLHECYKNYLLIEENKR